MKRPVHSPFAQPASLPFCSLATVTYTPVVVVAPHPVDATLGCGGLIALLRGLNCEVRVLVISDDTMSYPRSHLSVSTKRRDLHEQETLAGLAILGVSAESVTFLRWPNQADEEYSPDIREVIAHARAYLAQAAPQLIVLPWRNDPHPDHRVVWRFIRSALVYLPFIPRLVEYGIWNWQPEQHGQHPDPARFAGWRLDIGTVLEAKHRAIAASRSQIYDRVDEPDEFQLTGNMLANFMHPWEVYLEEK